MNCDLTSQMPNSEIQIFMSQKGHLKVDSRGKLFKRGNYRLEKGFDRRNYSRGDIFQERILKVN